MRETREVGVKPDEVPDNMIALKVVGRRIRDNEGFYCPVGSFAVLDEATAKRYLDMNVVQVELPEFKSGEDKENEEAAKKAEVEALIAARVKELREADEKAAQNEAKNAKSSASTGGQAEAATSEDKRKA